MRHLQRYVIPFSLLLTTPIYAQTTVPTSPQEVLRLAREAEKNGILKQMVGCPILPPAKIGDVVILGVEKGHLTLRTRLPATGTQSRLEITDLPGICTLTSRQVDNAAVANTAYEPDLFLLERYRFDEPNATVAATTVEGLPNSVQVAWSSETLTGMTQVMLLEQVSPTGPGADRAPNIILRASTQLNDDDKNNSQIDLKAKDFQTLRREHPAEVEKYLGPILRELHAEEAVLPSDTVLAWQVFASEAKLDSDLVDKIHDQVKQLDADDYDDRQSAAKSLEKIGPATAIELSRLERAKLSAEQTSVIDGLIKEFHPVDAETARRLSTDPEFLLSCLNDTDAFVAHTAFGHLKKVVGPGIKFDFTAGSEVRRNAIQKLRDKVESKSNIPSGLARAATQP